MSERERDRDRDCDHAACRDELDALLTAPAFTADPYPVYARFREEAPVHFSEANGGWMLFRYDDVHATLRDPARFSSRGRFSAALRRIDPGTRARIGPLTDHFTVGMLANDPPDHTRLRGLVNRAFTPRVVENMRPRIHAIVGDLLDAALPRGEFDLIADFAYPLPATVIAELFGAPAAEQDRFKRWSNDILGFQGTGNPEAGAVLRAQDSLLEMRAFLKDLADHRRAHPGDDLLGLLVAAEAAGDRLSEQELLTVCVTLLTAGHETTTNLIGNGMRLLLRHPEQLARLREDPGLMASAVEEMLRADSPLQRNPRQAAVDLDLGGQRIRAGDYVMQVLGSANHDPAAFPAPERFDIGRTPNRHVAFGGGIHFCLGAPLARLEAPIAIGEVLRRAPGLALAEPDAPPRWLRSGLLRGLERLPVAVR
ncbi:MAG: cytochrome P450 [Chloroflexota bacterium]